MNIAFNSICVLRLTALGDCINAFGMLNAIKKATPQIKIVWVIDSRFAPLFRDISGKDIIPLQEINFKEKSLFKTILSFRKSFRHNRFDLLLNLQTSIKASMVSLCINAREKYGYDKQRAREGHKFFITKQVNSPSNPHVLAGFLAFANQSGFGDVTPLWDFKLSPVEIKKAHELTLGRNRIFTISPASAKAYKNWTAEGYSAVARYAMQKDFSIVLLGSRNESDLSLCCEIQSSLSNNCINLCGQTSLRDMAAVISVSSLVLSPDSAALHLSSALNVPVIGLFAIHNPDRVGAWNYRDLEVSVYKQLAQAEVNGDKISWRYRVKTPDAMKQISIQSVINAIDKALLKYRL